MSVNNIIDIYKKIDLLEPNSRYLHFTVDDWKELAISSRNGRVLWGLGFEKKRVIKTLYDTNGVELYYDTYYSKDDEKIYFCVEEPIDCIVYEFLSPITADITRERYLHSITIECTLSSLSGDCLEKSDAFSVKNNKPPYTYDIQKSTKDWFGKKIYNSKIHKINTANKKEGNAQSGYKRTGSTWLHFVLKFNVYNDNPEAYSYDVHAEDKLFDVNTFLYRLPSFKIWSNVSGFLTATQEVSTTTVAKNGDSTVSTKYSSHCAKIFQVEDIDTSSNLFPITVKAVITGCPGIYGFEYSDVDYETNPGGSIYYKGHYVDDNASRLRPDVQSYDLYCVYDEEDNDVDYSFKSIDKVTKVSEVK